jgi:tRNA(adenine34) deaminase
MNDVHHMRRALEQARRAYEWGEFPVGCVIAHRERVLASGFRRGTAATGPPNEIDHAEMVALRRMHRLQPEIEPGELTLFSTLEPCLMCFGAILIGGIGRIVYAYEDVMGGGTRCDRSRWSPLYREHPIEIVANVLRQESVALLQAYFAAEINTYWRGSLLARYTADQ